MKVTDIGNVNRFFDAVDKCEGKVELVTDINIRQGDIISYNHSDTEKLMKCIGNS
ncbi:MAG: hypothetical protein IKB01_05960 [Lachnospiraceae bacterium]|nr:hypothetical protein [Lachnospiraceae bacterium]